MTSSLTDRQQGAHELESEQRFASTLIESMPGIFYLYDEKGRFLRWNRNFESVSGYSAEEIAGLHPLDFFTSEEKQLLNERIAEVFARGESSVEASFVTKSGRTIPYFFTGKRIRFDGATCLVGVGLDIAERKRAEEALRQREQRLSSVYEAVGDVIFYIAVEPEDRYRFISVNRAFSRVTGLPDEAVVGRRVDEVIPEGSLGLVVGRYRQAIDGKCIVRWEETTDYPTGKLTGEVTISPVVDENGRCTHLVGSVHDITDRVQASQRIRRLHDDLQRHAAQLEQRVTERTADLALAKAAAESADRLKSAFLATMSHELRTPLNSIIGFTGIVLQGLAGPINSEQTKQLGMVQGSARHLLELINDVLDISKIEAGELEVHFAPLDPRESIERVAALVKPLAEAKGLVLRVEVPPTLDPMESDRRRVDQILLNLLNNAIKFTDRGGVTVTAAAVASFDPTGTREGGPAVSIRVSDTGMGIKPEDLETLFQPFRQIDTGIARQHEGTGLGLAICRRLTGLLGGTIRAESVRGEGSVFTVILPVARGTRRE